MGPTLKSRKKSALTLPALQRDASRACVACGAPADSYCAQCAVTPYCSARCQRKDWVDRHKSVCHNLARLNRKSETVASTSQQTEVPKIPAAAPLRRPHSPAQRDTSREEGSSGAQRKPQQQSYYNNKNRPFNNNRNDNRNENRNENRNDTRNCNRYARPGNRNQNQPEDAEDWSTPKPTTPLAKAQSQQPKPNQEPPVNPMPKPEPVASVKPVLTPQLIKAINGLKGPGSLEDVTPANKIVPKTPTEQSTRSVNGLKGPGSLNDVTPASKIVPKNYLLDVLSIGDTALMSVDMNAADCRTNKPGFICLSLHDNFETEYQNLCEVYVVDCEAIKENYTPKPGESFSYFAVEDSGWYRARCLTPTLAALLDSGKIVTLKSTDRVKMLLPKYEQYPEFCCLLNAPGIEIGSSLKCTLVSKLPDGYKVSLKNVETGAVLGEGEVSRWLPKVEYPPTSPSVRAAISPSEMPEVPRPDVTNNSRVILVDATAIDRVFVRPIGVASQKRHDALLQDVVLYGRSASPIKGHPQKGQVVIGRHTDGLHYRALCKRTSVKKNKYLLEYIEFGNEELSTVEKIYPCPPNLSLSAVRTEVSMITLQCNANGMLTTAAEQYLEKIRDSSAELILTLPSGAQSAASGSAACLSIAKTNESVNKKVEYMCTPEWKKMLERGADVVESECLTLQDVEYLDLPASGCELEILDMSAFENGSVSACQKGSTLMKWITENLTPRMAEYCNSELGKEPYLPKSEELCIARYPPYPQWFRAVLLHQEPGAPTAEVSYLDYGNCEEVPVNMLRKMLPEFVRGEPALAINIDIQDFPKEPSQDALRRAVEHMKINDEGRGTLVVTALHKQVSGSYVAEAPGLLHAMAGKAPR